MKSATFIDFSKPVGGTKLHPVMLPAVDSSLVPSALMAQYRVAFQASIKLRTKTGMH